MSLSGRKFAMVLTAKLTD